ncbi:Uncharacterised protein [BD1-7 clade bacterium]|nr:Uncharacterised protein [BD1-7 clade bacterium]
MVGKLTKQRLKQRGSSNGIERAILGSSRCHPLNPTTTLRNMGDGLYEIRSTALENGAPEGAPAQPTITAQNSDTIKQAQKSA